MKSIFHTIVLLLLALTVTSCDLSVLTQVEPPYYEKRDFENNVRNSVRKAIQTPGLDNGTTVVVTSTGDTLIAPIDSVMRATPNRTVYVEIQSPNYPKGVSGRAVEIISIISIVGFICALVLILLLGVFIIMIRRQNGRNSVISKAIESNYLLPESFFTGHPKAAPIRITQLFETIKRAGSNKSENHDWQKPADQAEDNTYAGNETSNFSELTNAVNKAVKTAYTPGKQISTSVILIGLGIVIFISLASSGEAGAGFFFGGTLLVFGLAKIITVYLANKL